MKRVNSDIDLGYKVFHFIGHDTYLEVEDKPNGWVHTRIMHSKHYNRPKDFSLVYRAIYACPREDLPGVLAKAQSGDHGLWGANSDY